MKLSLKANSYGLWFLFIFAIHFSSAQKGGLSLSQKLEQLMVFDSTNQSKVLVLATHHFKKEVLSEENQSALEQLSQLLSKFEPTKVVVEWEPKDFEKTNADFKKYLLDSSFIQNRHNEVYQIGFRLAKRMGHDSIYMFDDQTEFIGSLEGFTFDSFATYASENDAGFYDKYLEEITQKFQNNQEIFQKQNLLDQLVLRNSPIAQKFNTQRMHSFEVRVGIQKSWIGPDWVGRWYRRNVRMMANVVKMNSPGDKILIIVGDNHKWVLDALFRDTPDFELISSWDFLTKTTLD